jgi:two-component system response regulator HydG
MSPGGRSGRADRSVRFVAQSRAMRAIVEQVRRFAAADSNVLVSGESGTGKNAIARELHARGPRAAHPFVTIDCAALPASLIDSELFGHERGAFTDAVVARAGRFELAGAGTVFLDGVTELALEAQGKLLRIVEEKRVERLGGSSSLDVPARVVASANADVEDAVRTGAFRGDLFHRLRVLPIRLPPLRERTEDVLPLARYFLERAAAAAKQPPPSLSRDASSALRDYAWPGNVRELGHALERAWRSAEGRTIGIEHLPAEILEAPALGDAETLARRPTLDQVERRYVAATLRHVRGNQTEASRLLGISRKALWEKRKRYGLD